MSGQAIVEGASAPSEWETSWELVALGRGARPISPDELAERIGTDDPVWLVRWTSYAEALEEAHKVMQQLARAESGLASQADVDEALGELGDPRLSVWRDIERHRWPTVTEAGSALLYEVLLPAVEEAGRTVDLSDQGDQAIFAWVLWVTEVASQRRRVDRWSEEVGHQGDPDRTMRDRRWAAGLKRPDLLLLRDAPGLLRLTQTIDDHLAAFAGDEALPRPLTVREHLAGLLPAELAGKVTSQAETLLAYRDRLLTQGVTDLGIDDDGFTEILAGFLPRLSGRMRDGRSTLIVGPTSSGKSHVGMIAAGHVISQRHRNVVVLLPTKALVAQSVDNWNAFFRDGADGSPLDGVSPRWKVVASSRDYLENDDVVASGDFDVAIVIPEKLSAFLANGHHPLTRCGLIIVDELQFLNAQGRGANIEALLTMLRAQYDDIPILGLSATITPGSAIDLKHWIGIGDDDEGGLVTSQHRPVPLDRYACDARRRRGLLANGTQTDDMVDLERRFPQWAATAHMHDAIRGEVFDRYKTAISLVVELLTTKTGSILCFVRSRAEAELVSEGIRVALELEGVPAQGLNQNPFLGRYSGLAPEIARNRLDEFETMPDLQVTRDVRRGLLTGIAYHTGRLLPELRRVVERAYAEGQIRVLVATETLTVGLNMPAEHVVVANLTAPTANEGGERYDRVLDEHDIAQRVGRAGRLGQTESGAAYIVAAPPPLAPRLRIDDAQLARLVASQPQPEQLAGRSEMLARRNLTNLDAVFSYYIEDAADLGEAIASQIEIDRFALLLLQDLGRGARSRTRDDVREHAARIFRGSLRNAEGKAAFDIDLILEVLEERRLIGPVDDAGDSLMITGLGRALSLGNLAIRNARCVAHLAEAAIEGAGPLTLLYTAARSDYVGETIDWIAVSKGQQAATEAAQKVAILEFVRTFASDAWRARAETRLRDTEFLRYVDGNLLGSGPRADVLRKVVFERNPAELDSETVTGLLRAALSYLWMRGCPTQTMITAITANTQVANPNPRSTRPILIQVHPVDVAALGQALSYVLRASGELLRVRPTGSVHIDLKNMADSVDIGLPFELEALLGLRLPFLHRERLSLIARVVEDQVYDDPSDLLDLYDHLDWAQTNNERRALRAGAFTEEERTQIDELLTKRSERERRGRRAVSYQARNEAVPSSRGGHGDYTFGDVAHQLYHAPTATSVLEELAHLLERFNVQGELIAGMPYPHLQLTIDGPDSDPVDLYAIHDSLTVETVQGLAGQRRTLLHSKRLTAGAASYLRKHPTPSLLVLRPPILIEALFRIFQQWKIEQIANDDETADLARRVMFFLTSSQGAVRMQDASLGELARGLPPPPPI